MKGALPHARAVLYLRSTVLTSPLDHRQAITKYFT